MADEHEILNRRVADENHVSSELQVDGHREWRGPGRRENRAVQMSNENTDDPTDYVLVAYEKGTETPVGRPIMTFTSREGTERAMNDDDLRARYKDVDLKIEEFTGDHTSVYRVGEYVPKCPPPEPPLGTVVKDRHGALSMRQKYSTLEGWGDPWGGTMPYGRWADMWEARGPLEVVPHPRTVKEERVADTTPKIFAVVENGEWSGVIAAFTNEADANKFAEHPVVIKSHGKVGVQPIDVLSGEPKQVILYRKSSGGQVVAAEKFWDFEVEERLTQGWFRTVEEAFND